MYKRQIYVRLSKEDGDISSSAKLESNSISNQKALILDFLKDKMCIRDREHPIRSLGIRAADLVLDDIPVQLDLFGRCV